MVDTPDDHSSDEENLSEEDFNLSDALVGTDLEKLIENRKNPRRAFSSTPYEKAFFPRYGSSSSH